MAQTHVLAAHLETHGDLIADPEFDSEHLIASFPIEAFEELWEPKNWVLVNGVGEPVETIEEADPDRQATEAERVDKASLRKQHVKKFTRAKSGTSAKASSEKTEG